MKNPKDGRSRNVPNGGNGRPKGTPNKTTREIKNMVLEALEGAGGVGYLIERAHDPRTASAFLGLVGKVIPLQVKGEFSSPDGSMTPMIIAIRPAVPVDEA
jgi:hypothetical protein